jgi:C1A family cysteine protease
MCGLQPVEKPRFGSKCSKFLKRPTFFLKKKIPDSWDWQTRDVITPVKSQGECGACAAFSICGAMESQKLIFLSSPSFSYRVFMGDSPKIETEKKEKESPDLSEAHLFFCSSHRCDTGAAFNSLLSFAKDTGVTKEEFFPYSADTFNTCLPKDGFDDVHKDFIFRFDLLKEGEK